MRRFAVNVGRIAFLVLWTAMFTYGVHRIPHFPGGLADIHPPFQPYYVRAAVILVGCPAFAWLIVGAHRLILYTRRYSRA